LYNLANAYRHVNKINLALETVQKYLAACDESDPFYNFASNIEANCYTDKGEYEKAIGIYNVLLSKLQENDILVGYTYNNLGLIYCHINDYKESIKYFEMAEKIISEIDKSLLSHTLIEKSTVLLNENLYTDAIETIELGLTYAKEYNDIEYLIKGNYILAGIYDKLNYTENLENVYLEMIDLLRTTCNKNDLKSIYDTLALIYLKKNKLALCEKYLVLSKYLN
jgi:tetratricopeptide (TPR) repeat protein